jgi:hypothetical protein
LTFSSAAVEIGFGLARGCTYIRKAVILFCTNVSEKTEIGAREKQKLPLSNSRLKHLLIECRVEASNSPE